MSNYESFELEDNSGEVHEYRLTKHAPMDGGLDIVNSLLEMLSGPLVKLARSFVDGNVGLDKEAAEVIKEIELEDEIRKLISDLDENLIFKLFSNTQRDGNDLDEERHFNKAFRGNYGEMLEAAYNVVRVNGFLSSVYTRALGKMKSLESVEMQEFDPEQVIRT
jgi:hypothetical protein